MDSARPQTRHAPEEAAKHVTIWNTLEHRKIAGNAAPLRKNLERYLRTHPGCEEYTGQDKDPNRAPIDPVTGQHILHLNEHVPIWHTLENRKVTGNAAPLRKNLQAYLRKHPQCEVYQNQDKAPTHLRPFHPTAPSSTPSIRNNRTNSAQTTTTTNSSRTTTPSPNVSFAMQIRNPIYDTLYNTPTARPRPTYPQSNPPQAPDPPPPPVPPRPSTPSYSDMVSSWSNQPEWALPNFYPPSSPMAIGTPKHPAIFANAALDNPEHCLNGIPIPGGVARDRQDLVMGASLETSIQVTSDVAHFLWSSTPRSIDHDPDLMQCSPSHYLTTGPLSGPNPPSFSGPGSASLRTAHFPHQ